VSDDSTQPGNPFTSRGFIAAAIVIGVILLAAVIVLVTTLTAPHSPVTKPTSSPSGPVASGSDKSVCGLPDFETESSLTAAPDTKWELVGTVAAPSDPKVGPGKTNSDRLRTCFAHTAEGALYAAINYFASASDARTIPFLPDLIADGPGKDAALSSGDPKFAPSNTRVQVAGFKVNSYSSTEAVIDLALTVTSASGQLVSMPVAVVWQNGDWKLELADDGSFPFSAAPLQSLGGYLPWAGV
jgi:hypothetical protein